MLMSLCFALSISAPAARADLGRNLAQGLTYIDWRFNATRDVIGNGYTINGAVNYNNREFDFGNADLTLTGPMVFTGSYTKRGIPELELSLNTANIPLQYQFNINTGAQDLTATGSVLIDISTTVNKYGFYDQLFQISNRGTYETDGYLLRNGDTLDFDIGPIDIHGNLYFDALAVLSEPLFDLAGVENVFTKLTGRAQKAADFSLQRDALLARLEAGEQLSDQEIEDLVNSAIVSAMLGGESPDQAFEELLAQNVLTQIGDPTATATDLPELEQVPEPATLMLMTGALAGLLLCRRRP
jgi:hypothetical protein